MNPFRRPRPFITDPLPDPVPRGAVLEETAEAVELEQDARLRHAARIVHRALVAQHLLPSEDRNHELVDVLLDLRSTLVPSSPGSEVLREGPPVRLGYQVPVVPGRAS